MKLVKLVIDIPEDYQRLCPEYYPYDLVISQILQAVKKGTKLDGALAETYSHGYTKKDDPIPRSRAYRRFFLGDLLNRKEWKEKMNACKNTNESI